MIDWFAQWRLNRLLAKKELLTKSVALLRKSSTRAHQQWLTDRNYELSWTQRKIAFWREFLASS